MFCVVFCFKIPKAGGNAVRIVMSQCFKMVEASDLGAGFDTEPVSYQVILILCRLLFLECHV